MFDLNLKNAFFLMRASILELRKSGRGRFIAIASRAAVEPGPGVGAYGASKAALISLVKTAAAENKDAGMTANAILSGHYGHSCQSAVRSQCGFFKVGATVQCSEFGFMVGR
jgi:NAD(P)-dependent dehydrogenase (short-subunit alcohol dehydrogenase family)